MFRYYLMLAVSRCKQNVPIVGLLVLTMAIGIASCMTALTVFATLAGDALPGISPHLHVVTMDARETSKDEGKFDGIAADSYLTLSDAEQLVNTHQARQQVALAQSYERLASPDGKTSDQVLGLIAHGPLLEMLGVSLRDGRSWTEAEQSQHAPVVVIDADLAKKLFDTERAVGRSVAMGTRTFRVIGVSAPWKPHTEFLDLPRNQGSVLGQNEQFFIPAQAAIEGGVGPVTSGECGKDAAVVSFQSADVSHCRWLETWVALDTPTAVSSYRSFLTGYADALHASGHFVNAPKAALYGAQEWMTMNHVVPDDVRLNTMLAGAFLLLCMVNVAGLLAARFLRRQADVAIRRALGASRCQVFAQHLIETGVLGVAGGVLALPLTWLGLWIVRMQPVAYAEAAGFSIAAFAWLLLFSVAVGLVVGILPAWRICRLPPAMQIKQA